LGTGYWKELKRNNKIRSIVYKCNIKEVRDNYKATRLLNMIDH
jgi:hypothetical protein